MKLYKLTNEQGRTYGETQWGAGITHTAPGRGDLCGPGWIHAYTDPLLAVLLNPIHANFNSPRLWEADGEVGLSDHSLKVGCARLTTIRELPLPQITLEQRVRFAILCAKVVCTDRGWTRWADGWLDGTDRTAGTAAEVAEAAWAAWAARAARAVWAARAAAEAVARAVEAEISIDLIALARRAVEEI